MKPSRLLITTTFLTAALVSSAGFADTILGVYAGAGTWQTDLSGDLGTVPIDIENLGVNDESTNFFYVALEHPIPVIPNIRLQKSDLSMMETATITQSFQLDDQVFSVDSEINSDIDLSHTDVTLYYELLDNWVNLDLGLTARVFDGHIALNNQTILTESESIDLDVTLPMVYVKAQFDLPFSGFYVNANGNIISYDGHSLSDFSAGVGYQSDGLVLDFGVEFGLRRFRLELDNLDNDLNADVDLSGPYASVMIHF